MAEAMRYLRRRRERAQRRVLAVTVACGTGASALSVAFAVLLTTGSPASAGPASAELGQHSHSTPEDGHASDAAADAAPEAGPPMVGVPDRTDEDAPPDTHSSPGHGH
jgi:hypothetical protein